MTRPNVREVCSCLTRMTRDTATRINSSGQKLGEPVKAEVPSVPVKAKLLLERPLTLALKVIVKIAMRLVESWVSGRSDTRNR